MRVEFQFNLQITGDNNSLLRFEATPPTPSTLDETAEDSGDTKPDVRNRVLEAGTSVLAPGLSMPVGG